MPVLLIGAIFWKRATTAGAITSMSLGIMTVLGFMLKEGLEANTPIYYSLSAGLVSFVRVNLWPRRPMAPLSWPDRQEKAAASKGAAAFAFSGVVADACALRR